MRIKGYKAFSENRVNRYGYQFNEGKHYRVNGDISFGNYGNGFHFCTNIEDTFRYVDAMNSKVELAEVIGSGEMVKYNDEYYGYYDMYAASDLDVVRFLSRKEIVEHFLINANSLAVRRFVSTFKLTEEEIVLFKYKFFDDIDILNAIKYYQENDKDVYSKEVDFKRYYKKSRRIFNE